MIHTRDYMTSVMMDQAPSAEFHGVSEVRVRRPATSDIEAVLEMLGRCSRASLFHRFHGFTDGADYFGALLRDRPIDHTFLAWYGSRCVGVASLGVGATGVSHLGVLIEDAWQHRSIGTWLVASLLASARAKDMTTVHADVLGDDLFILEALRRIGPLTVAIEFGGYSVDIDIGRPGSQPSGNRLPVGLETANGGDRSLDRARAEVLGRRRGVRS
jgi:N-acetylglutamate synthase-like GNAT family acetyltransferase